MKLLVQTLVAVAIDSAGNAVNDDLTNAFGDDIQRAVNDAIEAKLGSHPRISRAETLTAVLPEEGPDRFESAIDLAFAGFALNAGENSLAGRLAVMERIFSEYENFEQRFTALMQNVKKAHQSGDHLKLSSPDNLVPIQHPTLVMAEIDDHGRITYHVHSSHTMLWGLLLMLCSLYDGSWPEEVVESPEVTEIFPSMLDGMNDDTVEFLLICQNTMKDLADKALREQESKRHEQTDPA